MSYSIRKASLRDIGFIVEAIVAAEKSHSDRFGLASFFGLSESNVRGYISDILEEEIVGCEFSLESFMVAVQADDIPIAAVAGWVECHNDELPSQLLKSNLIGFVYPSEAIQYVRERKDLIQDLVIPRQPGALQIEYVYVSSEHRGQRLAQKLIEAHIAQALQISEVSKAEVQLFSNNVGAIKLYNRLRFAIQGRYIAQEKNILEYLAHSEKLLMVKNLNV